MKLLKKDEINDFIETYEKYGKSVVLTKYKKLTSRQINSLKQRLKIKHRDHFILNKEEYLNSKYGCYILGILWADGHVNKKSNRISIDLQKNDGLDIFNIFDKINHEWKIKNRTTYRSDKSKRKDQITIWLTNKFLKSFLVDYNFLNKSGGSPEKLLNDIKYVDYWLRGYFDGDGCLHIRKNRNICSLSFASVKEQDWNFLKKIILDLNLKSFKIVKRENNVSKSSVYKSESLFESKILMKFIYKDNEFIGLKRKYLLFLQLKNMTNRKKSKYE